MDPLELDFHDASVETLAENDWLNLQLLKAPAMGIDGYVFSHEERCNGQIVAILPFRRVGKDAWEALLRDEIVPPWGLSSSLCAITGGCDHEGEEPFNVALRELEEEAVARFFGALVKPFPVQALQPREEAAAVVESDIAGLKFIEPLSF